MSLLNACTCLQASRYVHYLGRRVYVQDENAGGTADAHAMLIKPIPSVHVHYSVH